MDPDEVVEPDRARRRAELDRCLHRRNVGKHFDRDPISSIASLSEHDLGIE
jgi:hypothetical protein